MRRAGILLHPSSLPSRGPIGDIGPAARTFVDWLAQAGCSSWQILPLNPVGPGRSPYASPSALASEPSLISLDDLVEEGLLDRVEGPWPRDRVDADAVDTWKRPLLDLAADRLAQRDPAALEAYAAAQPWVEDWALFSALGGGWWDWEDRGLKLRKKADMARARRLLGPGIRRAIALQLIFDRQWARLRAHADSRGVSIIGDIPIYVSGDGCDTWVDRSAFRLDGEGRPTVRAGVPPDYFSPEGQLWGNPLYDWAEQERSGFSWWKNRLSRILQHVHRVRLDHFRGFAAAWCVPPEARSAVEGHWEKGPGKAFFDAIGPLPLIAEDLGVITPDVEALREGLGAPGMKVLQFAFGDDADHPFLPHNWGHSRWVAYTGTHDNDTARGWYASADEASRHRFRVYVARDGGDCAWDLIRLAWSSVAGDAIAPMQDVLDLGAEARMNVPGTATGNWSWRMQGPAPEAAAWRLRELAWAYGRLPA